MANDQPDISLEQAIEKTKSAGIQLSFDKGQTIAVDLFQLQQDIRKANSTIETFKWIFGVIIIGAVFTTIVLLADYFQFTTKAYQEFTTRMSEQSLDHKAIESIQKDIQLIKELKTLKK